MHPTIRHGALVGALLCLHGLGAAQPVAPGETGDLAERMERARRAADGPLRRIQDAPQATVPTRTTVLTVQVPAKPAVAKPPSVAAASPATPARAKPAEVALPAVAGAPTTPSTSTASSSPEARRSPPTSPAETAPEPPVARATDGVAPAVTGPSPATDVVAAAVSGPSTASEPAAPKLISMVEPVFPDNFDPGQVGSALRFVLRFSILRDGQVSDVRVQEGLSDRKARSAVRQAVERWRYAPVAEEQTHQVELIVQVQS